MRPRRNFLKLRVMLNRKDNKMTQELKQIIKSGKFYSRFNKRIGDPTNPILLKWKGKYSCEIRTFSIDSLNLEGKYVLQIELYSDSGLGPRIWVKEPELEGFLKGEPLSDGSYLFGKGLKSLEEN